MDSVGVIKLFPVPKITVDVGAEYQLTGLLAVTISVVVLLLHNVLLKPVVTFVGELQDSFMT